MSITAARLRTLMRRLGPLGVAGLLLALGALAVAASQFESLETRVAALQKEVRKLETEARSRQASGVKPPASVAEQLGAFYAKLPPVEEAIVLVGRLNEAAVAADLKLQSAEYRMVPDASGKFARYQVSMPVTGTYPQVRKFVSAALRALPSASIDEIVMKRESIQATRLEAQLKITVFLGTGGRVLQVPAASNEAAQSAQATPGGEP